MAYTKISQDNVKNESLSFRIVVITTVVVTLLQWASKTIAIRLVSMLLIGLNFSNNEISDLLGCSPRTVRDLRKAMHKVSPMHLGDLLRIKKGSGRPASVEEATQKKIVEEVDLNPYSSLKQIAAMAATKFRSKISTKILGRILKKFGSIKRKVRSYPGKADPKLQRSFYNDKLAALLESAKNGSIQLFFLDGSHFVLSFGMIGYLYGTFRKFVKTFTGKKRYNVLGAINFQSLDLITLSTEKNLTQVAIIEFLKDLAIRYYNTPITIILDNAKYQNCKLVKLVAEKLCINLVYLPPYSPNLNLIERVWKFVKERLRMKYYDNFGIFKSEVDTILADINSKYRNDIQSLITEKFEFYDDLEEISEGTLKKSTSDISKAA